MLSGALTPLFSRFDERMLYFKRRKSPWNQIKTSPRNGLFMIGVASFKSYWSQLSNDAILVSWSCFHLAPSCEGRHPFTESFPHRINEHFIYNTWSNDIFRFHCIFFLTAWFFLFYIFLLAILFFYWHTPLDVFFIPYAISGASICCAIMRAKHGHKTFLYWFVFNENGVDRTLRFRGIDRRQAHHNLSNVRSIYGHVLILWFYKVDSWLWFESYFVVSHCFTSSLWPIWRSWKLFFY